MPNPTTDKLFVGTRRVVAMRAGIAPVKKVLLGNQRIWPPVQLRDLAGQLAAISSASGFLKALRSIDGDLASISALAGDARIARALRGDLEALSALAGDVTVRRALAAVLSANAALTGSASVRRALSGDLSAVSALSGDLRVVHLVSLAGTLAATSALAGDLTVVSPASSFTFVDSSNTATSTGTIPAAAQIGDLCVCFNAATQNDTVPTQVVPTDFEILANHIRDGANFRVRGLISAKILESGEPGSNVTLMSAGNSNRGILAVFRPNAPITSFTANGVQGEGTGGDPAEQTINVTGSPSFPAISLAHWGATSAIASRVATNLTDISGSSTAHWAAYRLDNVGGSPANGVVDMADSGSNVMQSLYLTFA